MGEAAPLGSWHRRARDHVVAFDQGAPLYQRDLCARVAGWVGALRQRPGTRFAVYHENTFEYLCILLALWQLRRTACIPGDNRPATLERLGAELDGLVGQFDADATVSAPLAHELADGDWIVPAQDAVALEIYTSGSTGTPKSIRKTIDQLERENEAIETLWPCRPGAVTLATVSHQHIFGMTFGLFWPFATGRPIEAKYCEFNEDIRFRGAHYERFALVSSPSHLGRFGETTDWQDIAGRCEYVISSAAPLAREDSLRVSRLLGAPVREIYGSSETGAIAWRIQREADADAGWRALPGVRLETAADGTTMLRSPYQRDPDTFPLPDRIDLAADGSFRLLGRIDDIVKVEGKRVSLAAIENALRQNALVDEVKALTLERARVETAVVARLSEAGRAQLEAGGRRELIEGLRRELRRDFDAVVIPRRWRFVEQMPFNRQGKLPLASLRALFARAPLREPQILSREDDGSRVVLHCRIPPDLLYFKGHMPQRPILAGIVQVHWAARFGRELFAIGGRFERLERVKFQQVMVPEYEVSLTLAWDADRASLSFRYESDRGLHSSGRICFSD